MGAVVHYTIEYLLDGNPDVVGYYAKANDKWPELFVSMKNDDVSKWAKWLSDAQLIFFEPKCGGRLLGQEVMAWSGFGHLYSTQSGFEENRVQAEKLREAFKQSWVSLEVKGMAEDAAASYLG